MSCETVRENLLAHLYGALEEPEERAVAEHLETCAECRAALRRAEVECAALAEATRLDAGGMEFRPPEEDAPAKPRGRVVRGLRLTAAAALVLAVTGLFITWQALRAPVLVRHPRLVVSGPSAIPPQAPGRFVVRTETVNGSPIPGEVRAVVTGASGVLFDEKVDSDGVLNLDLPTGIGRAGDVLRLDVRAACEGHVVGTATLFSRDASHLSAYVATDKPLYRPGDVIRARAVVLERFSLTPAGSAPVKLRLVGPKGDKLAEVGVQSEKGVAACLFHVPPNAPGGEYRIVAAHPGGAFPETARAVSLRSYRPPRLKADVELDRDSYGPGDEGVAWLSVTRAEGGIPEGAIAAATVTVDGVDVAKTEHPLAPDGSLAVPFRIPEKVETGRARIGLVITDGGVVQSVTRTVPVALGKLRATLYPEGGDLVAGLVNRVYFSVEDMKGDAADLAADVVDRAGEVVGVAKVDVLGMGAFDLVPREGESYRLVARKPAGVRVEGAPLTAVGEGVVMRSLSGSAPANAALDFELTGTTSGEHSVTAWCRDVLVAQEKVMLEAGKTRRLSLEPNADVGGVFRVTVTDPAGRPVAERLVSRAPARRVAVSLRPEAEDYSPGDTVKVSVLTTDEAGKPVPAVLGVAAVDDAVLALADDEDTAPLPMHFLLGLEVKELERTELFAKGPESARAVDLLLGTQGWRRFAWRKAPANAASPAKLITVDNLEAAKRAVRRDYREANEFLAAGGILLGLVLVAVGWAWLLWRFWRWLIGRPGWRPVVATAGAFASSAVILLLLVALATPHMLGAHMDTGAAMVRSSVQDLPQNGQEVLVDLDDVTNGLEGLVITFNDSLNPESVGYIRIEARDDYGFVVDGLSGVNGLRVADGYRQGFEDWEFWWAYDEDHLAELKRLVRLPGYFSMGSYERVYAHRRKTGGEAGRKDFAEVLYWNPLLTTGEDGTATIEFDTPDSITSFRITAEANDSRGGLGVGDATIRNRVPFWVEPKLPVALTEGDRLLLPVVAANDTRVPATVSVDLVGEATKTLDLASGARGRVLFPLVAGKEDLPVVVAGGQAEGIAGDRTERTIPVSPRGYPIRTDASGRLDKRATFDLLLPAEMDRATLRGDLRLYPSVVSQLADGIEGMLGAPHGCFEQVSSSTYPNVLILSYLTETESAAPAVARRAKQYLEDGYARLSGYECDGGGFDWYGGDAGHEALTAYGLMEFSEMSRYVQVDAAMVERTRDWLLSRRDGKGGFRSDVNRHSFGSAPAPVSNAYILWSLTEAGVTEGLDAEVALLEKRARESDDPYLVALSALTLLNLDRPAAKGLVEKLARLQGGDGGFTGAATSITASRGENLVTETTALAAIAFLEDGRRLAEAERAVLFLAERRRGGGTFGATQATVLTLKALVTHARLARRASTDHDLTVFVNGRAVGDRHVPAGSAGAVVFGDAVTAALVPGKNQVELRTTGAEVLPFYLSLTYRSEVPPSDPECAVRVAPALAKDRLREGETVDLTVTLTNREQEKVPMTVARVGLPAGLAPRVERLRELKDAGEIAFFETRPREVTLYLLGLAPEEERKVVFDLTADVPGEFEGPATSAYLYYEDDRQDWAPPLSVRIDPR